MSIVVTGAAGFIGFHVTQELLGQGETVIGIDNLSPYYDLKLKNARLAILKKERNFFFFERDIAAFGGLLEALKSAPGGLDDVTGMIHLAAQAGVRYSLDHPFSYTDANVTGHLGILEVARRLPSLEHMIYASSSSVYGGNKKLPFSETDTVDQPVSLYAATKKAGELMSHTYAQLYGVAQTGLRFFTVYGPWGRPDMAYWLFTEAIMRDKPIRVFNRGDMARDFTYIDDVVPAILTLLDKPPSQIGGIPHRIYNIGNSKPEPLLQFIEMIEQAVGRKAVKEFLPMQPGDVKETYADISALKSAIGFEPRTPIAEGIPKFVAWYRDYNRNIAPI